MNLSTPTPKKKSKRIPFASVAYLLAGTTLIGQLLGFLRTKLINANFPALGPQSTDAYFAAFNIPDMFFFTIAAGALGVAFMPYLSDRLERGDKHGAFALTNSLLNLLAVIMLGVGVVIFVFAEPLIKYIVAPNLTDAQLHNATTIMRLIAFNPFIFTVSGILTSLQQSLGRFFFYAIAPIFYNSCIIASAIIFSVAPGNDGGPGNLGLIGLGFGALAGAVLQLLIIVIGLVDMHYKWRPKIMWRYDDFKATLRQLPSRSLDQGVDQLNSIVETNFARRIGEGVISFYNNAYILSTAPTLLIGTAISTAVFPRLNQRLSQGRHDLFRKDFLDVLRTIIWITAPVAVVCYFGRGYLARLIFANNAPEIAVIFGYLVIAIFFRTVYTIISRWFYSQKDTVTPMLVSVFTIALNITLVYLLSRPTAYGMTGLALAQSIAAFAEVLVLSIIMVYRDPKLLDQKFWSGVMRIVSVTGFSVISGYMVIMNFPLGARDGGLEVFVKLSSLTLAVGVVHVAVSSLFGLNEARPVVSRLKKLALKPIRLQ